MTLIISCTMQNPNHNNAEDKFSMNFNNFDTESLFNAAHMGGLNLGMKRSAHDAGLDREMGLSSDDEELIKKEDRMHASSSRENSIHYNHQPQTNLDQESKQNQQKPSILPNGKKTKGRVKIKMEFIDNKLRRYTTFSKRKTGIMKKAYELSTLTGTQVMLLVASETGHVYTFATRKLQPMITSEAGKALIQTCLNSPDPPQVNNIHHHHDQRMSATGYEETELTYAVTEEEHKSPGLPEDYLNGSSCSGSDCSSPPTPSMSPVHASIFPLTSASLLSNPSVISSTTATQGLPVHLPSGLVLTPSVADSKGSSSVFTTANDTPKPSTTPVTSSTNYEVPNTAINCDSNTSRIHRPVSIASPTTSTTTITIKKAPTLSGGSVMVGGTGGSLMYSHGGSVLYAPSQSSLQDGATPLLLNLPPGLQLTQEQGSGSNHHLVMNFASAAALQQSAAAAAVVSAASAVAAAAAASQNNSLNHQSLPTDLSLHIKRENRS